MRMGATELTQRANDESGARARKGCNAEPPAPETADRMQLLLRRRDLRERRLGSVGAPP